MSEEELKPCPFCGTQIIYFNETAEQEKLMGVSVNGPQHFAFHCYDCKYVLRYGTRSQIIQRNLWNTRRAESDEQR